MKSVGAKERGQMHALWIEHSAKFRQRKKKETRMQLLWIELDELLDMCERIRLVAKRTNSPQYLQIPHRMLTTEVIFSLALSQVS